MSPAINGIKIFLSNDLKQYNKTFEKIMSSNVPLVDTVAKYIVRHRGKGLRPMLVLMSARLTGEPNANTYIVASIIELLHTATLVHDDVVDDAHVRRNFPSINAIWKNKISVLIGDYLLSKSLIGATETGNIYVMKVLAETAKKMSKGELMQIEKSRKLNITEAEYYQLISDKTAALISASCELGALTVSPNNSDHEALKKYGEYLGIAFQIKDDLLDYEGNQNILGKPVGADLKGKKITLPLILSLNKAPEKERKTIIGIVKKGVSNNDVKKVISFSEKYGGLDQAKKSAENYGKMAGECIAHFPDGKAKESALQFISFVLNRKK